MQNYGEKNAMADCWIEMATTLAKESKLDEAVRAFRTAIAFYTEVSDSDKENFSALAQMRMTQRMMADALSEQHRMDDAATFYQLSFGTFSELVDRDHRNLEWQYELAMCGTGLGKVLEKKKDRNGAISRYSEASAQLEHLLTISPENRKYTSALAEVKNRLRSLDGGS
jgi:tetratricopeptide (TPR) repeat protein